MTNIFIQKILTHRQKKVAQFYQEQLISLSLHFYFLTKTLVDFIVLAFLFPYKKVK